MAELVTSAPSQWVKWMISARRDAGKQVLRAAGEPGDLVRKHRTANQNVVVLDDEPVERDRHVLAQPTAGELRDLARGHRAEVHERRRIVPAVIEDMSSPDAAIPDRPADVSATTASSPIGECVPSATR